MSTREGLHEAGHVLAGAVVRGLPRPHSVVALGATNGGHVATWWDELPLDDRGLRDMATAGLAGQAALLVFGDPDPGRGADFDRQMAEGACRLLSPARASALYVDLEKRAIALCREHRSAIERFADTIEANGGRLGGSEIDEAVAAAFRGWPSPRFDANGRLDFAMLRRAHFEALIGDQQFAETPAGVSARLAYWGEADRAARAGSPVPRPWEAQQMQWKPIAAAWWRWMPTRAWRPQP